jgi:hypothetical protein
MVFFSAFSIVWLRYGTCIRSRLQVTEWETPTLLGPLERANPKHRAVLYCSLEYRTMGKVQTPINTNWHSPPSEPFTINVLKVHLIPEINFPTTFTSRMYPSVYFTSIVNVIQIAFKQLRGSDAGILEVTSLGTNARLR